MATPTPAWKLPQNCYRGHLKDLNQPKPPGVPGQRCPVAAPHCLGTHSCSGSASMEKPGLGAPTAVTPAAAGWLGTITCPGPGASCSCRETLKSESWSLPAWSLWGWGGCQDLWAPCPHWRRLLLEPLTCPLSPGCGWFPEFIRYHRVIANLTPRTDSTACAGSENRQDRAGTPGNLQQPTKSENTLVKPYKGNWHLGILPEHVKHCWKP